MRACHFDVASGSFKCHFGALFGRAVLWGNHLEQKGEVGWYTHPKGENSVASCKKSLGWVTSPAWSKIGNRKQSSYVIGHQCSVQATAG